MPTLVYLTYLPFLVPLDCVAMAGQSVGCQVILRYLAQLPPDKRVGGFLATGCWLTVDYKTKATRSPGIEALLQKDKELLDPWLDYSDIDFKVGRGTSSPGCWGRNDQDVVGSED